MRVVAIIPARAGSKRLLHKNMIDLGGKPLIEWTVDAAISARCLSRICISTDIPELLDKYQNSKVDIIKRPKELAGDLTPTEEVIQHALESLDPIYNLIVLLQPTSPFRIPGDIDNAMRLLVSSGADSLFSARKVHGFAWDGDKPINYDPVNRPRGQDFENAILEENGSIYIFHPWAIFTKQSRLAGKIISYIQPDWCGHQIDTLEDLEHARCLLPLQRNLSGTVEPS